MAEFSGKLQTYACNTDESADFTIIAHEDSTLMPGSKITCEGVLPHFMKKMPLILFGECDAYGVFKVERYCFDTSPSHLSEFLRDTKSLPVRLCNAVTAKYKGDFLWKLEDGMALQLVSDGLLSMEQAQSVISLFASCAEIYRLWKCLANMGLSCLQIDALYEKYGLQTRMQVMKNPYSCASFAGLDLEQGDRLAMLADTRSGSAFSKYTKCCDPRINFVVRLAASWVESSGDCYISLEELERILCKYTVSGILGKIDEGLLLASALSGSIFLPVIEEGELRIYLRVYYEKEKEAVAQLGRLAKTKQEAIAVQEEDMKRYDEGQKAAIYGCLGENCVTAITGGPGTGKTTVLKAVVSAILQSGHSVSLCAPTGRAAARLSESTKNPASTIHRLLGIRSIMGREPSAVYNAQHPLSSDVVIVDESSMISLELFCSLLSAIKDGGRLILVGDPNQLPSVSPGRVLADVIESGAIPVFCLKTIHRQASGSSIVDNAYRILQSGKDHIAELSSDKQFEIEYAENAEDAVSRTLQIFASEYDVKNPYQLQILTPSKKGTAGKDAINQCIVESLPGRLRPKKGFAKYDKIMTIHNCYDEESTYMNGDIGVISEMTESGIFLSGSTRKNTFVRNLRDVDYAYASTTHKAQGSEYDHVVIVLDTEYPGMLYKSLFYTAVTRAKKKVTLIYTKDALQIAMTHESPARKSGLLYKLKNRA